MRPAGRGFTAAQACEPGEAPTPRTRAMWRRCGVAGYRSCCQCERVRRDAGSGVMTGKGNGSENGISETGVDNEEYTAPRRLWLPAAECRAAATCTLSDTLLCRAWRSGGKRVAEWTGAESTWQSCSMRSRPCEVVAIVLLSCVQ